MRPPRLDRTAGVAERKLKRTQVIVMCAVLALSQLLGCFAPAEARAAVDSFTGRADITITNKDAAWSGATAQCKATLHLPNGRMIVAYGRCISGDSYGVPYDGTYDYTATHIGGGRYSVTIWTHVSAAWNAGAFKPGAMKGTQDMGDITITYAVTVSFSKVSADAVITSGNNEYAYAGATYGIYDADSHQRVAIITTDGAGHASHQFEPNKRYYAVETTAPQGFTVNPERVYFETGVGASGVRFTDNPGTVRLSIRKKDSATLGSAQPGATLEGAEFKCVSLSTPGWEATGTTDKDGLLRFDRIPLGNIVVTETKAPRGYKLDPTPHEYEVHAGQMADTGVVQLVPEEDFKEDVTAFDIEIAKYRDTGSEESGLQDPAEGVRFDIISNTTGKVVGTLTTDADGTASTADAATVNPEVVSAEATYDPAKPWMGEGQRKPGHNGALPYDEAGYTVREDPATTPEGYRPAPDWQITAGQIADGATLHYIVDNDFVTSRIQIVKVDAETGQAVPLPGFTFQLLDAGKKPITQEVWFPNHSELSEFTTDESGCVTFPEALRVGAYYVREIATHPPYLLNGSDIKVEIRDDVPQSAPLTVVKVTDEQAMGIASIVKGCAEPDDRCAGMEGAEFDVIAQGDIVSPDGTVRAVAGEVVDHVATDSDGRAETKELYLGSGSATYAFVETKAPEGHVLDATPHEFTLTFEDASTEVVHAEASASNAPTHLHLDKTIMGTDDQLAGTEFAIWAKSDEIGLAADGGGAIAVRPDADSNEASARQVIDHAVVGVDAPEGCTVTLKDADGEVIVLADKANEIAPGAYEIAVEKGGKTMNVGNVKFDAEANKAYTIAVHEGIFGASAVVEEAGGIAKPIALEWNTDDAAFEASGLAEGTYAVTIDGGHAGDIAIETGRVSYASIEDGKLAVEPMLLIGDADMIHATTDKDGGIDIKHLAKGSYRMKEVEAPEGFVINSKVLAFTVDENGMTEGMPSFTIEVENDYTKVDVSKRDITNEAEVEGARLTITDAEGDVVDAWTSGTEPHRINALAPGEYTLTEEMTPNAYDKAQSVEFTVEETGEIQTVAMYDEPIEVTGEVDKRQEIADPTAKGTVENGDLRNKADVSVSEGGLYDYSLDYRSTSNTWTDEFTVEDPLDAVSDGMAELVGITTAQGWQDHDGLMNVWYTTNQTPDDFIDESGANATLSDGHDNPWLSDESNAGALGDDGRAIDYAGWRLWAEGVSTAEAAELSVADLGLAEGEKVTGIRFEYGRVEEGFTTRTGDWDREDLKSGHDDLDDIRAAHDEPFTTEDGGEAPYAPAIIHMKVTDAYTEGTQLDNSAKVDLCRNGGGEDLEDHDGDFVTQRPKLAASPLDQTGTASPVIPLALGGLGAGGMYLALRGRGVHSGRRRCAPRQA